ncbi:hypothetical protein NKJ09_22925 [Mesorhizobium sp. M0189]|uniref:hypothetical protein n=1 Tax=Mesorhizobium sp. M0189 TaxID=2956909 RepID=UPI00333DD63E
MGSSFTCKLNPCCGDRRNCEPPRQYYEDANEEASEPATPPGPTGEAVDGELEAIGWRYIPRGKAKGFLSRSTWLRSDGAQVFRTGGLWCAKLADGTPVRNCDVAELADIHPAPDRMARFGTAKRAMKEIAHISPAPTSAMDGEVVKALVERLRNEIIRLREEANMDDRAAEVSTNPDAKPCFVAFAITKRERADDIEAAALALSAQAVPTSAALAKDTSRFRKLSNVDDDTAPTSELDGETVLLKQVVNPLFTFYRNCRYKVVNRTGYGFLLEDERGNRATVHESFIVDEAALIPVQS